MVRRRNVLLAAVAAFALVLAGCGGDDEGGTDTPAQQETQFADLKGQTVNVAAVWTGTEQENFKKVLDGFAQKTGATVNYTPTGDDVAAFLNSRIAGGSPPDVAIVPQPAIITELAGKSQAFPIDEVAGSLVDQNFAPDWKTLGSVDGKLYAVFFKGANKSTFWFNKPVLEEAGVQAPQDWEALKTAAGTVTDSGTPALSIAGGDGWTLTDWFENVYIRVAGGEKYDQLTKHEIPWTDESVKTTLTKLSELWSNADTINGGYRGALGTAFPESVTAVFAEQPSAAMVYEGDFVGGVIAGETPFKTPEQLAEVADFFNFPAVDGSSPAVVGGGDAAILLKDAAPGKELIKYLTTPEAAELWVAAGGFTSPNKNVDLSKYPDELSRKSAQALVSAETFRFDMSDLTPPAFGGTPSQGMWKALQDFLAAPTAANVDKTAAALEKAAAAAYK